MTRALAAQGLTKRFGAVVATDDVTLTLDTGEIHALIGPNGAGKSTLIGLLAGTIAPDAGRVLIGGQDVTGLDAAARARAGLGRSFQIAQLAMAASARANVRLAAIGAGPGPWGLWRSARRSAPLAERVDRALARAGLPPERADLPVGTLSHGERRQVEIAAALALHPRVFLLDEPMAGLGQEGTARMTALLEGLRHEAPILLVEHDMDAVFRLADRVSVLVSGRVIFSGRPEAARADAGVRAAYLGEEGA